MKRERGSLVKVGSEEQEHVENVGESPRVDDSQSPASTSQEAQTKQDTNGPVPIALGALIWLLAFDWVFQWHRWFWHKLIFPLTDFARFGIVIGLALVGFVLALLGKKGLRYSGLMVAAIFAPVWLAMWGAFFIVTSPVTVLPYPRRVFARVLSALRWLCTSLAGKVAMLCAVAGFAVLIPSLSDRTLVWVSTGIMSIAFLFYLGGFLHLATGPLAFVEAWHHFLHLIYRGARAFSKTLGYEKTLPSSSDATQTTWFRFLVYSAAYMEIKRDDLEHAKSLWRYLGAFLLGLSVTFCVSALAFSSAFHVLLRFAPIGAVSVADDFVTRITLSLGIITNLYVPQAFISPPSWYTLVVFLEVAVCFYLLAVAILAFSVGARSSTEKMADSLQHMWSKSAQSSKVEMERVDPGGDHDKRIKDAKAVTLRKLR